MSSVLVLIAVLALAGCIGSDQSPGEHSGDSESGENSGGSESGEHGVGTESGDGGEESGTQFALDETFDEIRAGARLVLSYDSASNAFIGNVENTTDTTLRRVRVEVHLSNGIELGPTTPTDLAPGQSLDITLPATDRPFTTWSAHPRGRLIAHARNSAGGVGCGVSCSVKHVEALREAPLQTAIVAN